MSTTESDRPAANAEERKAQILVAGAALGALLGVLTSYLYARAAEEHGESESNTRASVSTGQLLAVLLATLGLVRQIAELGKPKKDDKSGKK